MKNNRLLFLCIILFNLVQVSYSQETTDIYRDVITIEEVKITNKKPKLKTIKFKKPWYGIPFPEFYLEFYNHTYLVKDFPFGKVEEIILHFVKNTNFLYPKEIKGKNNSEYKKNEKNPTPQKYKLIIYEANKDGNIGKQINSEDIEFTIIGNGRIVKKTISVSKYNLETDNFFIRLIPVEIIEKKRVAYSPILINGKEYFYVTDKDKKTKSGYGLKMDLKVLTKEY